MCWRILLQLSLSGLCQVHTWRYLRNIPCKNNEKLISMLHSSTMKEFDSFLPNTVSSRGHEGWWGLNVGKHLSARSASRTLLWQDFAKLQPSPTFVTKTRNGVDCITCLILRRWSSIESSFFGHFYSGCFLQYYVDTPQFLDVLGGVLSQATRDLMKWIELVDWLH